jgi:iron(III) transport system substrate-binding protein
VHPQVKDKAGRTPLANIKQMKDDPVGVLKQAEDIKARYAKLFHV